MDKKTEVKRLLERAESQKGIERAKTLKAVLELVSELRIKGTQTEDDGRTVATVEIRFSFSDNVFDGVDDPVKPGLEEVFAKIDAAQNLETCQKLVSDFYKSEVQRAAITVDLPGVGVCEIIPSAKLRGEVGSCINGTAGRFGLQTAKKVAKRLLTALMAMQDIVAKGTASAFVRSDHKPNDKALYSRVFHVMAGRFPCSVLFTIKKSTSGEKVPYHLNAEGSHSFDRALFEYLNSMKVTEDGVEVSGKVKTPL